MELFCISYSIFLHRLVGTSICGKPPHFVDDFFSVLDVVIEEKNVLSKTLLLITNKKLNSAISV